MYGIETHAQGTYEPIMIDKITTSPPKKNQTNPAAVATKPTINMFNMYNK